ncbi:MAG: hypothetical protein IKY02_06670, partial [Lachnospiraceae bacterium]|nr:hypothetical protein [Lachnospiraceae bacterium]
MARIREPEVYRFGGVVTPSLTSKAFAAIRNLEFVRYHVFPAGYMVRVSSQSNEERVRISKRVFSAGIRFAYVGGTYIKKFRETGVVRHVR